MFWQAKHTNPEVKDYLYELSMCCWTTPYSKMRHFRIGGGERLILQRGWWTSEVVNVWGGERLGWWTSGVVNVWFYTGGGECLRWWTSGVVNVWGGERLGWWTSGVVNVWFYTGGGERLGWWTSGVVNVWVVNVLQSTELILCVLRTCWVGIRSFEVFGVNQEIWIC